MVLKRDSYFFFFFLVPESEASIGSLTAAIWVGEVRGPLDLERGGVF